MNENDGKTVTDKTIPTSSIEMPAKDKTKMMRTPEKGSKAKKVLDETVKDSEEPSRMEDTVQASSQPR